MFGCGAARPLRAITSNAMKNDGNLQPVVSWRPTPPRAGPRRGCGSVGSVLFPSDLLRGHEPESAGKPDALQALCVGGTHLRSGEAYGVRGFTAAFPARFVGKPLAPWQCAMTLNPVGRGSCRAGSRRRRGRLGGSLALPHLGSWCTSAGARGGVRLRRHRSASSSRACREDPASGCTRVRQPPGSRCRQ